APVTSVTPPCTPPWRGRGTPDASLLRHLPRHDRVPVQDLRQVREVVRPQRGTTYVRQLLPRGQRHRPALVLGRRRQLAERFEVLAVLGQHYPLRLPLARDAVRSRVVARRVELFVRVPLRQAGHSDLLRQPPHYLL